MTHACSRRGVLAGLVAIGLAGGCADRDGTLRVGSQRGGSKAMMLASDALQGAPFAVEWSEFPDAQHLLEALGAGAVDLGTVGDAPFLFAFQAGKAVRAVQATRFVPRNVANAILLPQGSAIRDVAALRGRKVATGRGSVGHFLLLRALERAAVPVAEVDTIFLPPGDAKAAFEAGVVDAWATWNPYVGAALLHGDARVLVDGRAFVQGYGFMVASEGAIAARPAVLRDFLRRHARAQTWASEHRDACAALLARETGLPAVDARYFADRAMVVVPIDDALLARQRAVLATFVRAGVTVGERPLAAAFDDRFA